MNNFQPVKSAVRCLLSRRPGSLVTQMLSVNIGIGKIGGCHSIASNGIVRGPKDITFSLDTDTN
jgi:hypothetical protein